MTEQSIHTLNEKFGISGKLHFEEGKGGLAIGRITLGDITSDIALQGGYVLTYEKQGTPVLFLSKKSKFEKGKSFRGGVPICWPWFGPHETDPSKPSHGHVRVAPWNVIASKESDQGIEIIMQLETRPEHRNIWPHDTELRVIIQVGKTLGVTLETTNNEKADITISEALHTYFHVSNIQTTEVLGLEGKEYCDKVDGMKHKIQSGSVRFTGETDRVYFDCPEDTVIHDPGLNRSIRIATTHSRSTVVWNPWDKKAEQMGDFEADGWKNMVCVETANAMKNKVTIPAGQKHSMGMRISVE